MAGGRPAALLLDFDGTLADTLATLRAIYRSFLEERSVAARDEEFDELNGVPLLQAIRTLRARHGWSESAERLVDLYRARLRELYPATTPAQGAAELLDFARDCGIPVAIVSSGARAEIAEWLARNGLRERVAAIVAAEDVERGKPDPEPYRRAATALGVDAARCVAIEDSAIGARAARDAGAEVLLLGAADLPGTTRCMNLADALERLRERCSA